MTNLQERLNDALINVKWNRSSVFPASNYLTISLKLLGCVDVSHKLYRHPDGSFEVALSYTYADSRERTIFKCTRKSHNKRTDAAYSWLLCSLTLKYYLKSKFKISMPLPKIWDLDGLQLHTNNYFEQIAHNTDSNTDLGTIQTKLKDLETRLSKLELANA